jgi:AraC-like DNA-binding protein
MASIALQTVETSNVEWKASAALPPNCSFRAGNPEIDTLVMATSCVAVGQFRCPVEHPAFTDSGPIPDPVFVFPRTSVWIQHDGERAFHSDPTNVTIYNRGQRYTRRASSTDGDRADWFALSEDLARNIAAAGDPSAIDAPRPFNRSRTKSTASLYLRQRLLLQQARRGELTAIELDERVIELAFAVLVGPSAQTSRVTSRSTMRRADVIEATRAELGRDLSENLSLGDVARIVRTSPFHLCRLFRSETGQTLRSYRNELRCRAALEDLATGLSTISTIAHRLGFASHAHFVRVAHRLFNDSPGALRRSLRS